APPSPRTPPSSSPSNRRPWRRRARCGRSRWALLVLLDDLLQIVGHLGKRLAPELHAPVGSLLAHQVELAGRRILVGVIVAEVRAAAFLALDRAARDGLGAGQKVPQIERRVPAGVVLAIALDADRLGALLETLDGLERAHHLLLAAHDADQVLHHVLQVVLDLERPLGVPAALEGRERILRGSLHLGAVDLARAILL